MAEVLAKNPKTIQKELNKYMNGIFGWFIYVRFLLPSDSAQWREAIKQQTELKGQDGFAANSRYTRFISPGIRYT